jgi:hypothetical protein
MRQEGGEIKVTPASTQKQFGRSNHQAKSVREGSIMNRRFLAAALAFFGMLGVTGKASAVPPAAEGTPFQIIGHIQKFTLFTPADVATFCPGIAAGLEGAKMTVNGVEVIIPCNTIVTMPATYLTLKDIFDLNPKAVAGESGLALDDSVAGRPLAAMEVALDGNIVTIPGVGVRHVAGMVHISQLSLFNGSGYVNRIDPDGTLHVGSSLTVVPAADALVRINDSGDDASSGGAPTVAPNDGRFGLRTSTLKIGTPFLAQDGRFTADTTNPTIHSETAYPMCIPRSAADPQCPLNNRPVAGGIPRSFFVMSSTPITTPAPGLVTIPACPLCDPTKQAPIMVGDYINYVGTLATGGYAADPPNTRYISAHTIAVWVGIYTAPGAPIAYVNQEVSLMGTGARTTDIVPDPLVPGGTIAQEVAPRTIKVEGITTDPSRAISVFALNMDSTGAITPLLVGTVPTETVPFGRFRFIITRAGVGRKGTLPTSPPVFVVTSPTKEIRVTVPGALTVGVANGLTSGQFDAPVSENIFAENTFFGQSLVPFNFHRFCHLAVGSGPLTTAGRTAGPVVGQLTPWPGNAGTTFGPPLTAPANPLCP